MEFILGVVAGSVIVIVGGTILIAQIFKHSRWK